MGEANTLEIREPIVERYRAQMGGFGSGPWQATYAAAVADIPALLLGRSQGHATVSKVYVTESRAAQLDADDDPEAD